MTVIYGDIARKVSSGATDTELNNVISSYLSDNNINETVEQWRIDNYKQLRRWAYPPMEEYNDAQTKLNSGISELETEGQSQLDAYVEKCLDVKTRFSKE